MVRTRDIRGFSVIELMIVVAIVGALSMVAAPSFVTLIKSTRIKGVASDLHMALLKARSEAVKRNASVRVQRAGANWGTGWDVVLVSDGTVLATRPAPEGISFTGDNPANVTYLRSGRISGAQPTFTVNTSPAFSSASVKIGRCRSVALTVSGIPSVSKVNCP